MVRILYKEKEFDTKEQAETYISKITHMENIIGIYMNFTIKNENEKFIVYSEMPSTLEGLLLSMKIK